MQKSACVLLYTCSFFLIMDDWLEMGSSFKFAKTKGQYT